MTFREVSIEGPPGEFTTSDNVDAKLLFGGFEISGEDVSDGFAPLQAPISLSGAVCSLGQTAAIAFSSGTTATASFTPGNLKIEGGQVAAVSGFGDPLAAKSLTLAVLGLDDPSAFTNPPPLRSSVVLEGGAVWHVSLPATDTPIGTLTTLADLYDQLSAEVGEDASGIRREVALFRAQSKADQFQLELGSGITDLNGAPLLVGLSGALQFYNFQSATPQVELLCSGRPVSPWAKSGGTGLLLGPGDPERLGNILFAFDGAKATALQCRFSLFGLVPPLNGAIVDPGDPAGFLSILPIGTVPDPAGELNWVLIGSLQHGAVRLRISSPTFNVLRPEDLLALKFRFEGMALLGSDGEAPGLAVAQPGRQGRLSVTFPPQHLVEHSYYSPDPTLLIAGDPSGTETPDSAPIAVRLGEESRLAFAVPSDAEPIPLDLQSLLSWSSLVQDIVKPASYLPSQQPAPGEQVGPQQPLGETSIELPYRLTLSPNASAGWSHRDEPVTNGEWTELWHTRLGVRKPIDGTPEEFFVDERDTDENLKLRAVRAVSSVDWPKPAGEPFPRGLGKGSALTSQDRHDIVANSSDFSQLAFLPQPAFVKRLMLSGLGGWLDARALWGDNPANSLQEWRHIAAQGRDQYVRVVRRGHLFPFGHRASWVTISERKFFGDLGGDSALNSAYVFERDFIVVTQPVCRYGNLSNSHTKGRDLPFTEIEITTLTTPTLDPPGQHLIAANAAGQPIVFWIYQQGGTPFLFHMRALDQDTSSDPRGQPIDPFSAAAIFVDATAQFLTDIAAAAQAYDTNPDNLAQADMGGQKIALAKPLIAGDTTYEVASFTFKTGVSPVPPSSPGDPTSNSFLIYPSVAQAAVHLPAVRQLTKPKDGAADQAVAISY
jgi:hypothetical protein